MISVGVNVTGRSLEPFCLHIFPLSERLRELALLAVLVSSASENEMLGWCSWLSRASHARGHEFDPRLEYIFVDELAPSLAVVQRFTPARLPKKGRLHDHGWPLFSFPPLTNCSLCVFFCVFFCVCFLLVCWVFVVLVGGKKVLRRILATFCV